MQTPQKSVGAFPLDTPVYIVVPKYISFGLDFLIIHLAVCKADCMPYAMK